MIASDFHIPFHSNKALDLLLYFLKENQPDYFVIGGDYLDAWEVSKFDKVPRTGKDFRDELEEGADILKLIRKIIPNTKIVYVAGNHEFRLRKYIITNARALYGLKGLTIQEQLGLNELNIEYIDNSDGLSRFGHNFWKIGELYIGHFDKVSKHAAYTAKNLMDDIGVSFIQGHTHRVGLTTKSFIDGRDLIGIEGGCMCELKPNYVVSPNWSHGISVFYKKKGKERFQVYPIKIADYKFFFGDKEFNLEDARKSLYSQG